MYVSVGANISYTPYVTMLPIAGYGMILCTDNLNWVQISIYENNAAYKHGMISNLGARIHVTVR